MGRRALRAVDPTLDLTGYLYALDEVPRPLNAATFFGRSAPLEVEMGSGKGLFLQAACQAHPERDYLGIELAHKYARFAAARLAQRQLTNGKVISGDGLRCFRECLTDDSVAAVHVYFPDPWWKKRHQKRRVMTPTFVRDLQRVLEPGGTLHFWTDVEEYFRASLELIATETSLAGPLPVAERAAEHDLDYRTHFERRMRLHDLPIHRAEYRKTLARANGEA